MTDKFIDKYNDRIVYVNGVCTFEDADEEKPVFFGKDVVRTSKTCIYCTEEGTYKLYVIPLITFLNNYAPYTAKVDDLLLNLNNQLNVENDGVRDIPPIPLLENKTKNEEPSES